ncbi:MAG: hypothetical protein V1784_04110 [bacterium]
MRHLPPLGREYDLVVPHGSALGRSAIAGLETHNGEIDEDEKVSLWVRKRFF